MPDARAHHRPPADPRAARRSPRRARPPPASASSATSSSRRRHRGAQYLPSPDAMDPERPPPALPSELLEEIFVRVASPADLARASAACSSFRRVIADHAFLRRYRSIHPPLLLGILDSDGFHPAEAPHPSAAVARAVSISFDYLPRTGLHHWVPCDAHNGRVLLERLRAKSLSSGWGWDLLVCDPLSRRYLLLPPVTDGLFASLRIQKKKAFRGGSSFIRSAGIEDDTSFSVINWVASRSRLGALIFSLGSGCWSVSTAISWRDLGLPRNVQDITCQCTNGCFYWKIYGISTFIKLDMNSMRFCTIGLPPGHEERRIVILESGESGVAMFSTIFQGTSVDYYTFSQNGSEKSLQWHLKRTIPLPAHYTCEGNIGGPAQGYIFIECIQDEEDTECFIFSSADCMEYLADRTYSVFFSLEIKSFNIERVGKTTSPADGAYPYFGFLPFMSARRI